MIADLLFALIVRSVTLTVIEHVATKVKAEYKQPFFGVVVVIGMPLRLLGYRRYRPHRGKLRLCKSD